MRASHQPGSTPIDIPETVPNPAYTPAPTPAPAPERAPTKVPEQVPEKVIAPDDSGVFFLSAIRGFRLCGSKNNHGSVKLVKHEHHANAAEKGETANIKQNTTNKGSFRGRRFG